MSLSMEFKTIAMHILIDDYLGKFQTALGLSARRGGFKSDIPGLYARLAMFKRSGNTDFAAWTDLINEAGRTFDEWYDWQQREYSTPHEALFNFSIDEWCKLGGLSGIAETLNSSPEAGQDAA